MALSKRITRDPQNGYNRKFKCEGQELVPVPDDVFKFTDLEVLDASPERETCLNFAMRELSKKIKNLKNLRILVLDTNNLTSLPPEIGDLNYLERITLSNNNLVHLPPEFSQLESLCSLHIANNQLREFPLEICCLENLEFLDMSDNKIRTIPQEIQLLTKLTTFNFYHNKLRKIPLGLCKLKNIRSMWLGKNRLTKLPTYFGRLTNLDWGEYYKSANIDGNPLVRPPVEVARQGPAAIRRFFDDKGKSWENVKEESDEEEWYPHSDSDDDYNVPEIRM